MKSAVTVSLVPEARGGPFVFHDDLMRLRTGSGPANMATIRHAALNIVKQIPDKASLKVRRKTLGWDDHYLLAALTQHRQ